MASHPLVAFHSSRGVLFHWGLKNWPKQNILGGSRMAACEDNIFAETTCPQLVKGIKYQSTGITCRHRTLAILHTKNWLEIFKIRELRKPKLRVYTVSLQPYCFPLPFTPTVLLYACNFGTPKLSWGENSALTQPTPVEIRKSSQYAIHPPVLILFMLSYYYVWGIARATRYLYLRDVFPCELNCALV